MSSATTAATAISRPPVPETPSAAEVLAAVGRIVKDEMPAWVRPIDEGAYPAPLLSRLAGAGAFGLQLREGHDLGATIEAMSLVSSQCTATAFMAWCQNTLGWYLLNATATVAQERYLDAVANGQVLGGTALSNPMKSFFGIESLKLRGERVSGGYKVKGVLPWVSNLGPDHLFGAIFAVDGREVPAMALIDCAEGAVTLKPCERFLAMDGTGTYAVQIRDLFVPDEMVLAHDAIAFVKTMRAGFVLLQAGMAIGLIRDCVAMMREVSGPLGHVNRYLEVQPEALADTLAGIEEEVARLAATPHDPDPAYWRRVVEARLIAGEASVTAAHGAMLHCGARGYVAAHRCQRRLREAYFVAIVTPATKQLRLMLDQMPLA